jgi:hypothetical protein
MKTILDCIGQEISVGDIVAYPGRSGSDLWMNLGVVTKIRKDLEGVIFVKSVCLVGMMRYRDRSQARSYPVFCLDRVLKIGSDTESDVKEALGCSN